MNSSKKLSLEDFKKTAKDSLKKEGIERIAGGILGACHNFTVSYTSYSSGTTVVTTMTSYCN